DLQGLPADKVQVRVVSLQGDRSTGYLAVEFRDPPRGLAPWPGPVTTDDKGRFSVRGLPADRTVTLQVAGDDRFARQRLAVQTGGKGAVKEVNFALAQAFLVEGTVTCADTGKPMPNALLRIMPYRRDFYSFDFREEMTARVDARGRFRFSAPSGNYFFL